MAFEISFIELRIFMNWGASKCHFVLFKHMRKTLLVLTVLVTLIACNNSDTTKTAKNIQVVQQIDTIKSTRNVLIEELKRLRQILASKNNPGNFRTPF